MSRLVPRTSHTLPASKQSLELSRCLDLVNVLEDISTRLAVIAVDPPLPFQQLKEAHHRCISMAIASPTYAAINVVHTQEVCQPSLVNCLSQSDWSIRVKSQTCDARRQLATRLEPSRYTELVGLPIQWPDVRTDEAPSPSTRRVLRPDADDARYSSATWFTDREATSQNIPCDCSDLDTQRARRRR